MQSLEEKIEAIKRQAAKQKKASRAIRILIIILLALSVTACTLGLPVLTLLIGPGLFNDIPDYFIFISLFIAYSVFFIIPFLLCMPIILPLAMRSRNTNRIVVFRKFNDDVSKKSLSKIIRGVIGNYGHVFTLSDKNFKIKWYVRLPFVLGQMSFFHFRSRVIKSQKNLAALEKKLQNRGWLNVNWYLSWSKVFAVKTTDEFWQDTAKVLLKEADLVIFDVSVFTSSIEWETKITKELNLENKIIVVANKSANETAVEWKRKYDSLDDDYDIPIHFYNDDSRVPVLKKLETDIAKVLALRIETSSSYVSKILKSTLITTGTVAAIFFVGLFFLGPFIIPEISGRYSPLKSQVFQSYLQLKMKTATAEEEAPVIFRMREKWRREAASLSTSYAFKHDVEECDAVVDALSEFADMSQFSAYSDLVFRGEPTMSEAAFKIVENLAGLKSDADVREFAFRLLSSNRLDIKAKGLALLQRQSSEPVVMDKLMQLLGDKNYQLDSMPYQHRTGGLLRSNRIPDYTIDKFYFDLYRYLDDNNAQVTDHALKNVIVSTQDRDVRYIFSLLLLKRRDATYLNEIINGYAIDRWYRRPIKEPGRGYFFTAVPEPFGKATDSMLIDGSPLRNLPSYATISGREKLEEGFPIPGSMVEFLIRHYSINILQDVKRYTDLATLSQVLYTYAKDGTTTQRQKCLQETREHTADMLGLLAGSTIEADNKLNVAWLLASVGEGNMLQFLVQQSRQGSFFSGWSNTTRVAEILDIIITHASRNNAVPIPEIPEDVPGRVKDRLNRLKEIWHG